MGSLRHRTENREDLNGYNPSNAYELHVAVWPMVSPPDANWKAPYSARFHVGASAPGG